MRDARWATGFLSKWALLVLAAALLALTMPGAGAWAQTSPLDGLEIRSVVTAGANPSRLYVQGFAGMRGRVLRSDDGGATWSDIGSGGLPAPEGWNGPLAVDYANPDRLYLETGVGLYRTDDAGGSWTLVSSRLGITALAVEFNDPNVLYAGIACDYACPDSPIIKSTDGGRTWGALGGGNVYAEQVTSILLDPRPGADRVYALSTSFRRGFTGAIYRGTRGGQWTRLPTKFDSSGILPSSLALDGATGQLYAGAFVTYGAGLPGLWRCTNPDVLDVSQVNWEVMRRFDSGLWLGPVAPDDYRMEIYIYTHSVYAPASKPLQLFALPLPANSRGPEPRMLSNWRLPTPTPYPWEASATADVPPAAPTAAVPPPPPPPPPSGAAAPAATATVTATLAPTATPEPTMRATPTVMWTPTSTPSSSPTLVAVLQPTATIAPSAAPAPSATVGALPARRTTPTWAFALLSGLGLALVASLAAIMAGAWMWWRRHKRLSP